jgi:HEAT repeat protein
MSFKIRCFAGLGLVGLVIVASLIIFRYHSPSYEYKGRPIVLWVLETGSNQESIKADATFAIKSMGSNALPALLACLHTKGPLLRQGFWGLVGHLSPSGRAASARLVKPPDKEYLRVCAARCLGFLGLAAEPATPDLAETLQSSVPEVRWESAKALAAIGKPSVPSLVQALHSSDAQVRHAAVFALGEIGPSADTAALDVVRALNDVSPDVRSSAVYALKQIGVPSLLKAKEFLEDPQSPGRDASALLVAQNYRAIHAAIPGLIQLAQAENPVSRTTALKTLGTIRAAELPAIKAMAAALKDPILEVRLCAVKSLGDVWWNAHSTLPDLLNLLNDSAPSVREATASTLSKLGVSAQSAIPQLTQLCEDKEESVRVAARYALGKISPNASPR